MAQVRFFKELVLCIKQLKLKIPWDLEMEFSELKKSITYLPVTYVKKFFRVLFEYIQLWYLKIIFSNILLFFFY